MAANGVDKRRLILDAAIRVFARKGFHHCRVSDVADEAGVAYGLVYHYFSSKEEILNTLFLERWQLLLDDARDLLIGLGDLGEVHGSERVRRPRHLDDDHLHQVGVVPVGLDDERRDGLELAPGRDVLAVDLADRLEHHVPALEEQRVQDLVLGPEVVVHQPIGDAGLVGDVAHAAGVEALAREHANGGVEDHPPLVDGLLGCHYAGTSDGQR